VRHVTDPDPTGRRAPLRAGMRVPVYRQRGRSRVDRLAQQVRPEERVDLRWLAEQRLRHRGVVGERHQHVTLHAAQLDTELLADAPGVPDDPLHLRLPELAAAPAGEAAAEALRAGDAQALPEAVDDDAATFEHHDAGVPEDLGDLVLGV